MKKGKAEEMLSDLANRIDELIQKARTSEYAQRIELEKRIEELKKDKQKLESDIRNFFREHEEEWKDIEKRGEDFLDEVKEAINNLADRFKNV